MSARKIFLLPVCILFIGLNQCIFDPVEPPVSNPDFSNSIDSVFQAIGKLSDPPSTSLVTLSEETGVEVMHDGSTYFCDQASLQLSKRLESFSAAAFDIANPNLAALFPGAIVRLKDLKDENILTSIGNVGRPEITLKSFELNGASKTVLPENASSAVAAMESEFSGEIPANFTYSAIEAYSKEQALLELGIKVNWLAGSVSNKFSVSESVEERSVMVSFIQAYHTVIMDYPGRPADFFTEDVTADQIAARMSPENPLGYISQVTYGRRIIAKISYSTSSSLTRNELALGLSKGLVGVNFSFDTELEQVLEESSIELSVLGGGTDILGQLSGGSNALEVLQNIQDYLQVDAQNVGIGLPIAYSVRYLVDNSLFAVGGVAEYKEQNCILDPEKLFVDRITVEQFPSREPDGGNWDDFINGYDPDVYWKLYSYDSASSEYSLLTSLDIDRRKENAESSDVPFGWTLTRPFELFDWKSKTISVALWDYDFFDDDYMGHVNFYFPGLIAESEEFPSKVTLANQSGSTRISLDLHWE